MNAFSKGTGLGHEAMGNSGAQSRAALQAGVIASVGFLPLQAALLGVGEARLLPQVLLAATGLFAVVTVATRLGGIRGLRVLWVLMLLFWVVQLYFAAPLDGPIRAPGQQLLARGLGVPGSFGSWSVIALPLFLATQVWQFRHRPHPSRWTTLAGPTLAWLVLFGVARYFRTIPWDLDPTPLAPATAAWVMALVFSPLPFGASAWMLISTRNAGMA
jgi:hypothetical protein